MVIASLDFRDMRASSALLVARVRDTIVALVLGLLAASTGSHSAVAAKQASFASPEQAVDALVAAIRAGNTGEMMNILGPGSGKLVRSGDAVADKQARAKFISEYEETHEINHQSDTRAGLALGKDAWPFPFPIVNQQGHWQFDSRAGAEEILDRRIGANELSAIEVCHAYVAAQREYAEKDPTHSGFDEYAQKFRSSPGQRDGLYWPADTDEDESPLGPLMASARAEGYAHGEAKEGPKPYHGYYYRILKAQGPNAKDGAYDYVVNGHMIAGFAMVAFPARYGASGVMTFIVNHDDVVYQKDLGPDTTEIAEKMTLFDPDPSWKTP